MMVCLQFVLLILAISGKAFAPISSDDIDPGWLTLSTGDNSQPTTNDQHSSTSAQPATEASLPASTNAKPIESIKKRRGQHIKSAHHIERIRASWTPERRRKQAEIARSHKGRAAKVSASWTEERRKAQAEVTRKIKTGFIHSKETREKMSKSRLGVKKSQATKDKIRQAVSQAHALRRERRAKEQQDKSQ
jgi:predicted small metal-binding protein